MTFITVKQKPHMYKTMQLFKKLKKIKIKLKKIFFNKLPLCFQSLDFVSVLDQIIECNIILVIR